MLTENGGFNRFNPFVLILSFVEWLGYKYSDQIVATMPNLGEHVSNILGYSRKVHCIPMGISEEMLAEESEPLTLSINSKGEIFIQESKVEYDRIIAKILAVSKNRTDTRIYVRGDKTINYGRVLEIMGMLSGSGFTKVALISEPYKER